MYKQAWWDQVIKSAGYKFVPVLIYKFEPVFKLSNYKRKTGSDNKIA